jgi:hypothetical protein
MRWASLINDYGFAIDKKESMCLGDQILEEDSRLLHIPMGSGQVPGLCASLPAPPPERRTNTTCKIFDEQSFPTIETL